MSFIARRDFFLEYETLPKEKQFPIIASHVAFTGYPWTERSRRIGKRNVYDKWVEIVHHNMEGHLNNTSFYPNSLNFYDEEIESILKSKGLIGIIFDIRVLGGKTDDKEVSEFLSFEEDTHWFGREAENFTQIIDETNIKFHEERLLREQIEEFDEMFPLKSPSELFMVQDEKFISLQKEKFDASKLDHLQYFMNNILHVVVIGKNVANVNPWDHKCIGSDFDGLIAPMHCCISCEEFPKLAIMLKDNLPCAAMTAGVPLDENQDAEYGINKIIDKFFFSNALTLIKNTLQAQEKLMSDLPE